MEALSLALATYTLLLDPAMIVLGGGLSQAGPALFDPVRTRLVKRLSFREAPPLLLAALGGWTRACWARPSWAGARPVGPTWGGELGRGCASGAVGVVRCSADQGRLAQR
ncbi:hypothetical protein ACFSTC_13935 [Nonomuraea ferruginea]